MTRPAPDGAPPAKPSPGFSSLASAFLLVAVAIPTFGLVLRVIVDPPPGMEAAKSDLKKKADEAKTTPRNR